MLFSYQVLDFNCTSDIIIFINQAATLKLRFKSMDKSCVSTVSTSIGDIDNKLTTIPIMGNLCQSFDLMTEQQIHFNLLQLNLVSMYNEQILQKMYNKSKSTKFYLKNRYILQKLINCTPKANSKQKPVREIVEKYDAVYVNGKQVNMNTKVKDVLKGGFRKQVRAKFISSREEFTGFLDHLSLQLKKKQKLLNEDDLLAYFQTELGKINGFQAHCNISPNKLQLVKQTSLSSSDSQSLSSIQAEQISNQSIESPKKPQPRTIFSLYFKNKIHEIKQINIQKCSFLSTKNRCPLILDFGFNRFLYKNDNQVSHQLISMHIMHYINSIISTDLQAKAFVVEYEIISEAYGALYQFVEGALTVNQIKLQYKGGIPEYLDFLESQNFQNSVVKISNVRKRFAQTFCGFSLVQYLLDLKDRNNSNIMIKKDGSIFHIDLAFMFNACPGGINFESAPFKFTKQYLNAMGGFESDCFKYYQSLMLSSMTKLCMNREQYLSKLNILSSRRQQILCFKKFKFDSYKNKIPSKPQDVRETIEKLISESYDSWRTNQYDDYQFNTNKILK